MQPKLDTAEKIRSALRQAGIEFSDYEPEQGFTLIVRGKALKEQLDQINEQESDHQEGGGAVFRVDPEGLNAYGAGTGRPKAPI
jgi:hypothetical protein